ncbi:MULTISPECIES: GNAT family N-acetyltransferase [Virgibacillus]|uniref:GNAT family N-acetyltransferase n=1 Tax=Virgibacillus TaxID=84406 RepID=UPI0004059B1A|nr:MULTISPECIES: GNAT family N-acetyltransferase [Bacillaceae]
MLSNLTFRLANLDDLNDIVKLLADDKLGEVREKYENPLPLSYHQAFQAIDSDPNNSLCVVEKENRVVGVLQITFTPYLTYQGGWRATIEGVRIDASVRGRGVGKKFMEWSIQQAKEKGCHVIQLTTDKQRPDALAFYQQLGFTNSHEGLKLHLEN